MRKEQPDKFDVAIVGGGVSGVYAAWRLAGDSQAEKSIGLFESSDRIGGRLWSVGLERETAIPAELGGMFFSDSQSLVHSLIKDVLALPIESVSPLPDFAYLRAKRFPIADFNQPGVPPYWLNKDEQGKSYHELLFLALHRIVPDLNQYWPLESSGSPDELIKHLRAVQFQDRYLHEWGFWNLLSKVLSNEAYLCLRDLVGSFAMFSNWNGYDAVLSTLWDLTGNWYRIPDGYEMLPHTLARSALHQGTSIHIDSRITRIELDPNESGLKLLVSQLEGQYWIHANAVILALPKRALINIEWGENLILDSSFCTYLDAVEGVPACKIFLTFNDPWWRRVPDGPGKIDKGTFGLSHTDLPMRQCYYLGMDADTGEGLLLASYSDATSVPFWSSLMTDSGRPSGLRSQISETALHEIRRQLSEMHGVEVPKPTGGTFVNWSSDPYGGGWHAWLPGWRSYEVMAELRRPISGVDLHICGEAVSAYEGWVEGALTSTEVTLQQEFGLASPDWLKASHTLSPYQR